MSIEGEKIGGRRLPPRMYSSNSLVHNQSQLSKLKITDMAQQSQTQYFFIIARLFTLGAKNVWSEAQCFFFDITSVKFDLRS